MLTYRSFGAYKQHQAGKLDWRMGGLWAGAVGLFATGDYFVSQYAVYLTSSECLSLTVSGICSRTSTPRNEDASRLGVVEDLLRLYCYANPGL